MSKETIPVGGFAVPDPEKAGFRYAVPRQVDLLERGGVKVLTFGSQYAAPGEMQVQSPPLRGCLEGFQRLSSGPDEQALEFARLWGSLDLCWHLVPAFHSARCGVLKVEPLAAWRFLATKLTATLTVAASLRVKASPALRDWRLMHDWPSPLTASEVEDIEGSLLPASAGERSPQPRFIPPPHTADRLAKLGSDDTASESEKTTSGDAGYARLATELNWAAVASAANEWLKVTAVYPRLYSAQKSPLTLAFGWSGLSGALAMQLVDALAHGEQYICDKCYQPFSTIQRRRPSWRDPNHYCPKCGAQDKYREVKKALAKERYWADGRTPKRRSITYPQGRQ